MSDVLPWRVQRCHASRKGMKRYISTFRHHERRHPRHTHSLGNLINLTLALQPNSYTLSNHTHFTRSSTTPSSAKMQFTTVISILFFAAAAYARTDCTQDANYCGWNLVSKGTPSYLPFCFAWRRVMWFCRVW